MMNISEHLKLKEKLEKLGLNDPTFEDLYLFAELNNISCVIDEVDGKWVYNIYYDEFIFNEVEYDSFDECELEMFKYLIYNFESIMVDKNDWYYTLTDEQRKQIERGLDDVKNGRVVPHEEVMKNIKKILNKNQNEI
jgi:hypothetical protein